MSSLGKRQSQHLNEQQITPAHKKRRRNIKDHEWRVLNFLIEERYLDRANIAVMLCGVPLDRARLEKERNRHPISVFEKQEMRLGNVSNVLPPEIEIKLSIENLPWLKARERIATHVISHGTVESFMSSTFASTTGRIEALAIHSTSSSLGMDFRTGASDTPIFDCMMRAILSVSNHLHRRDTSVFEESTETVLVKLLASNQAIPLLQMLYDEKMPTFSALLEILLKDALEHRNERLIRDLAEVWKINLNKTVSGPWTDLDVYHDNFHGVEFEALLPLEVAVRTFDTGMIKLLVSLGADLNAPCFAHQSLLAVSVEISSDDMAQSLIASGVMDVVRCLIDLGITDQSYAIPYFLSVEALGDARILVEKGFNTNRKTDDLPSALWIAASRNKSDLVRLLLDKGADLNLKHRIDDSHWSLQRMNWTLKEKVLLSLSHEETSPLVVASHAGFSDIVRMLLLHNPSDILFEDWRESFLAAVSCGHTYLMQVLLMHGPPADTFFGMEKALRLANPKPKLEVTRGSIRNRPTPEFKRSTSNVCKKGRGVKEFFPRRNEKIYHHVSRKIRGAGNSQNGPVIQDCMIWVMQSTFISDAECEAILAFLAKCSPNIGASISLYPDFNIGPPISLYRNLNGLCMLQPTLLSTAIQTRPSIVTFLLSNVSSPNDPTALYAALNATLCADVETRNLERLSVLSKAVFQSNDRPEIFLKAFSDELFKQALNDDDLRVSDTIFEAGARPTHFSTHEKFLQVAETNNADDFSRASDREVYIHSKYFNTKIPPACLANALRKAIPSIRKMRVLLKIGAPANFIMDASRRDQICCLGCSQGIVPEDGPLAIAFRLSSKDAVELLLKHGAQVDDCLIVKAIHGYCDRGYFIEPQQEMAEVFLSARQISRAEFIHEVAQRSGTILSESECRIILEWLDDCSMDDRAFVDHKSALNIQGFKCLRDAHQKLRMLDLISAVASKNVEEAKCLLEAGLDGKQVFHGLNSKAKSCQSPCFKPWSSLHEEDTINRSPLQLAAQNGCMDMVELLISYGADVNEPPAMERGVTALQAAAIGGFLQIAATLWEKGANVNAGGSQEDGRTALEGAAEWGRIDMVQLLLFAGADISTKSAFGKRQYKNAVKNARDRGHHAVADLIERCRGMKA